MRTVGPLDSSTSGVHSGVVDMDAPPCSQLFSFRSESLRRLSGSTVSRPGGGRRERGTSVKTKLEVETKLAETFEAVEGKRVFPEVSLELDVAARWASVTFTAETTDNHMLLTVSICREAEVAIVHTFCTKESV